MLSIYNGYILSEPIWTLCYKHEAVLYLYLDWSVSLCECIEQGGQLFIL